MLLMPLLWFITQVNVGSFGAEFCSFLHPGDFAQPWPDLPLDVLPSLHFVDD